jgi:hypothetical protein
MDLLYALAYPKRNVTEKDVSKQRKSDNLPLLPPPMEHVSEGEDDDSKAEDEEEIVHEFASEGNEDAALASEMQAMGIEEKGEDGDADEFKDGLAASVGDVPQENAPGDEDEEEIAP